MTTVTSQQPPAATEGGLDASQERRSVEEALKKSQSRFDAAAVAGRVRIWEWDVATDRV